MKRFFLLLMAAAILNTATAQVPELWGTMSVGGPFGIGGIIKINGDGTGYVMDYACLGGTAGGSLQSSLRPVNSTLVYGHSVSGGTQALGDIYRYHPATNSYTSLFSMDSLSGYYPRGTPIVATNNKLYGLTNNGGVYDKGVLFSYDPALNQYLKLHDFNDTTGQFPTGSVIQASTNNKLYGMTTTGGQNSCGVIFSYDISNSVYAVVHPFNFTTGFAPYGSLLQGSNGLLYGLASGGGSTGYGVLFSFDPANNGLNVIHHFNGTDGAAPMGTLVEDGGLLYGCTSQGGVNNRGVIFSCTLAGSNFTKLYDFALATGSGPFGGVLMASDGKLYGMTLNGGANSLGVIYSFHPGTGVYTKMYDGSFSTGGLPYADLIEYSAATAIGEWERELDPVRISPNPACGITSVHCNTVLLPASFTLLNSTGQIVREGGFHSETEPLKLDLPSGVYCLVVKTTGARYTKKVLVQ
ncbi:MAG: T9SS type A sorting domain-containing protein [Bacteroidia bacterium]|nr:T9SS type A sorting domain-containing protein [Bacteroidia bacterium]